MDIPNVTFKAAGTRSLIKSTKSISTGWTTKFNGNLDIECPEGEFAKGVPANNEIDSILDETKESIIKYIKMQFHEDISDFISTFSKQQIRNLQKHLYDFEEFEELKNYFQKPKGLSRKVCK